MEFFRTLPPKQCPECGDQITEQAESYLMNVTTAFPKKMNIKKRY
ncbi:protein YhfH [Peribacillus butanolivorans]